MLFEQAIINETVETRFPPSAPTVAIASDAIDLKVLNAFEGLQADDGSDLVVELIDLYLQDAARPIFELDRTTRAKMQKTLTEKLRPLRPQIERRVSTIAEEKTEEAQNEREQLQILSDCVLAAQASCHVDGKLPFDYPGLKGYQELDALDASLEEIKKNRRK